MPSKIDWEAHIKEFKLKSISLAEYSKINSLPYRVWSKYSSGVKMRESMVLAIGF